MTSVTRKLEQSLHIPQPPEVLWQVLADFGGVAKWAPRMRDSRVTGSQAAGIGTRRVMRHVWGFRIEETVTRWEDGKELAFRLDRAPPLMRDVDETWTIAEHLDGSLVSNRVSYAIAGGWIGATLDFVLIRWLVEREMMTSLRSLRHFADYRLYASRLARAPER